MSNIIEQLQETTAFIQNIYSHSPQIGIVLGSGLGNFANELMIEQEIPYDQIPHFPVSTVEGHSGKLMFGEIGGKKVVAMAGRFHFYEGYSASQVTYPIRVMKWLGIQTLLISNAAGGVNPGFRVGDLMILTDHISFATANPLIGKNFTELGPRFPDMSHPYSKKLIHKVRAIAGEMNISVKEGVYFGVTGPTFETRAEYKMIHKLVGDAVGISTVQEIIIGFHMGLEVFDMNVITDIRIRD